VIGRESRLEVMVMLSLTAPPFAVATTRTQEAAPKSATVSLTWVALTDQRHGIAAVVRRREGNAVAMLVPSTVNRISFARRAAVVIEVEARSARHQAQRRRVGAANERPGIVLREVGRASRQLVRGDADIAAVARVMVKLTVPSELSA
jgi:hypothetical protein